MLGRRDRTIPCIRCGYDITGLPREGVCPECALPLKQTLEASVFLRSLPRELIRWIDRGVFVLAWSPIALAAGLPIGFLLMVAWSFHSIADATIGLNLGLGLGLVGSVVCFVVGAVIVTTPIEGRPIGPQWARLTLRYAGPVAALAVGVTPYLQWTQVSTSPVLTLLLRGTCQVLSLAALAAALRVLKALEHQTQAGRGAHGRYWYGWGLLVVLGLVWLAWYWVRAFSWLGVTRMGGADWGGSLLAGVMILEIGVFWRAVDSVAIEWFAATYDQDHLVQGAQTAGETGLVEPRVAHTGAPSEVER